MALLSFGGIATVIPAPAAAERCTASRSTGAPAVPTADTLQETATSVVREINRERVARELVRLGADPRLALAAQRRYREIGVGVELGMPSAPAQASGATYAAELGSVRP